MSLVSLKRKRKNANSKMLKPNINCLSKLFNVTDGIGLFFKNNTNGKTEKDIVMLSTIRKNSLDFKSGELVYIANASIIPNSKRDFTEENIFSKSFISIKIKTTGLDWSKIKGAHDNSKKKHYFANIISRNFKNKYDFEPSCIISSSGIFYAIFSFETIVMLNNSYSKDLYIKTQKRLEQMMSLALEGINYLPQNKENVKLVIDKNKSISNYILLPGLKDCFGFKITALNDRLYRRKITLNELYNKTKAASLFNFESFSLKNTNPLKNIIKEQEKNLSKTFIIKLCNNRIKGIISYINTCKTNKKLSLKSFKIYQILGWICANVGLNEIETQDYLFKNINQYMGRYLPNKDIIKDFISKGWKYFTNEQVTKLTNDSIVSFLEMTEEEVNENIYFRTEAERKKNIKEQRELKSSLKSDFYLKNSLTIEEKALVLAICELSNMSIDYTCKSLFNKGRYIYYSALKDLQDKSRRDHQKVKYAYDVIRFEIQRTIDKKEKLNKFSNLSSFADLELVIDPDILKNSNKTITDAIKIITVSKLEQEKLRNDECKTGYNKNKTVQNILSNKKHNKLNVVKLISTGLKEIKRKLKDKYQEFFFSKYNLAYVPTIRTDLMDDKELENYYRTDYYKYLNKFAGKLSDYGIPIRVLTAV